MPRFPINSSQITDNKAIITGDEFKHIVKVLRFGKNDSVTLFDELHIEHTGKIVSVNNKELEIEILHSDKSSKESFTDINLYQSVPKGSRIDLIVQKTTELGIKSITPMRTQRSIVQDSRKSDRWTRIAVEACKQCGRSEPTQIKEFSDFSDIIKQLPKDGLNLLFYENSGDTLNSFLKKLNTNYKTINILIGPEGGFTTQEIDSAKQEGINIVGLGPRILRVETASIASVAVIQHHFGDL